MRLISLLKPAILLSILVLALSACAGNTANNAEQLEPTPVGEITVEEVDPTVTVDVETEVETPESTDSLAEEEPTLTPQVEGEETTEQVPETGGEADEDAQDVIDNPIMVFVSNVIGSQVVSEQGEEIGEIIDLAYDDHNGIVVYAIVSPEGDPDSSLRRQMAFPFYMLAHPDSAVGENVEQTERPGSVPDPLVFPGDSQAVQDAPSLETDELAEQEFALWSQELYYYWREVDAEFLIVGVSDATVLAKMSGLDRIQVIRGETGEVHPAQDIIIDLGTGNMLYIVLEAGKLTPGDQGLVMIPYEYLTYGSLEDGTIAYTFNLDEELIQSLPRLEKEAIPSE